MPLWGAEPHDTCRSVRSTAKRDAFVRARIERRERRITGRGATIVVAILLAGCGLASSHAHANTAPLHARHRPCPADDLQDVVARVNEVRARAGLRHVGFDGALARYAATRSASMASVHTLSHQGWERGLRRAGFVDDALGENVAYNYATPAEVMTAWMRSPGHRANIMRGVFRRVGIGCVIDDRGHRWWTQDFAG